MYKCEICTEELCSEEQLRQHLQIHIEEKPIKCELYDGVLDNENSFDVHVMCCKKEEPRKCNESGTEFVNENSLKEHHVNMHCNALSSRNTTSTSTFVFGQNVKNEVLLNDSFGVLSAPINEDNVHINGVKMEKIEFVECNVKDAFVDPVVKHEMVDGRWGDTEQVLEICKNEDIKSER